MKSPIKHCFSKLMHTEPWNKMRGTTAEVSGRGTGNKVALEQAKQTRNAPFKLTDESYEKSNQEMRSEYKSETGKTLGNRLTKGKSKRRVSFACRFAGMKGAMTKPNGKPTRKARALKKWGCGSVEAASSFCQSNKEKK